jgi:hypothetical protein
VTVTIITIITIITGGVMVVTVVTMPAYCLRRHGGDIHPRVD